MGSRILRSLPLALNKISLPGSRTATVTTDLFNRSPAEGYRIVQEASRNGINVGLDEYPTLQAFQQHIQKCKTFGLWNTSNQGSDVTEKSSDVTVEPKGLYTVGPCPLARGSPTVVAEIRVFLSRELYGEDGAILDSVVPFAEEMVSDIGEHYHSCVIQVAALCPAWISRIRKLGYIVTACIPRAVDLVGSGLTSNFIFYKKLKEDKTQVGTTRKGLMITLPAHISNKGR